jgi:hypothetical protein
MSDFAGTVPTRDPNYNARAGDTFPFRNSYREPAPEIVFQRGQGCAKGLRPWSFERWPFRRHFNVIVLEFGFADAGVPAADGPSGNCLAARRAFSRLLATGSVIYRCWAFHGGPILWQSRPA